VVNFENYYHRPLFNYVQVEGNDLNRGYILIFILQGY